MEPAPPQKFIANRLAGEDLSPAQLTSDYLLVRRQTESLAAPLGPEDQNLQSMPEASPVKWHRAHTTWFFETFILAEFAPGFEWYEPAYCELFNSYYNGVGRQHPRPIRALISRPDALEVGRYRQAIDEQIIELLDKIDEQRFRRLAPLMVLGLNHEQQHQELILTDLKHAFSSNPLAPACGRPPELHDANEPKALRWVGFEGGLAEIGHAGPSFCFDNETPRHRVYLNAAFELANRPVTCGEFLEFMADGGYTDPMLWLSDGWTWVRENRASAPLYWSRDGGEWFIYTLAGRRPLDPEQPVCHLNYYEAHAYAEWTGYRLPTEAEWEAAAAGIPVSGHFADSGLFQPRPAAAEAGSRLLDLFGNVWEWTTSAYAPYPGFRAAPGAVGEYNGKFMANQMVLRGGSCATPAGHVRPSYRNFFYPADRWQFTGVRLARDPE